MWLAVRAYGGHQEPQFTTIAHSAPVYVVVGRRADVEGGGGGGSW